MQKQYNFLAGSYLQCWQMEQAILLPLFANSMTSYSLQSATLPSCFQDTVRRHDEIPSSLYQPGQEEGL